jgi:hypothetical protein
MNDDHTQSFRDAFGKFLKEEHLETRYKQKELMDRWPEIMGQTIASRTSNVFFKGDTLFIVLSSASLKDETDRPNSFGFDFYMGCRFHLKNPPEPVPQSKESYFL